MNSTMKFTMTPDSSYCSFRIVEVPAFTKLKEALLDKYQDKLTLEVQQGMIPAGYFIESGPVGVHGWCGSTGFSGPQGPCGVTTPASKEEMEKRRLAEEERCKIQAEKDAARPPVKPENTCFYFRFEVPTEKVEEIQFIADGVVQSHPKNPAYGAPYRVMTANPVLIRTEEQMAIVPSPEAYKIFDLIKTRNPNISIAYLYSNNVWLNNMFDSVPIADAVPESIVYEKTRYIDTPTDKSTISIAIFEVDLEANLEVLFKILDLAAAN